MPAEWAHLQPSRDGRSEKVGDVARGPVLDACVEPSVAFEGRLVEQRHAHR